MGVLNHGFSKFRKTEHPVFSASQVDKYAQTYCNFSIRILIKVGRTLSFHVADSISQE